MSLFWEPKIQADALIMQSQFDGKVEHINCSGCRNFNHCSRLKKYCPIYRANGSVDFGPEYITVAENDGWEFQIKRENEGGSLQWREMKIAEGN